MPTDLSEMVEAFKREVSVPGTFAASYPTTSDDDIVGTLMDAFGETQLDGWFPSYVLDVFSNTVSNANVADDTLNGLSLGGQALVLIYAGMRMVRNQMMGMKSQVRYKAGSVEYETSTAATVLTQLLRDLAARRAELLGQVRYARTDYVMDSYYGRALLFYREEMPYSMLAGSMYGVSGSGVSRLGL